MQEDFHFYTIYTLARAAGLDPKEAGKVAYSSQYTDDSVEEDEIFFENDDDSFEPVLTAHRLLNPSVLTERTCKKVWVPFHFVPGNEGYNSDEKMLTRRNGNLISKIIDNFFHPPLPLPYNLHLLGIILHALADTWSHENFMGMVHEMNDISELKIIGKKGDFIQALIEKAAPKLGHAQAESVPDKPYLQWEYRNYNGDIIRQNNLERCLDAARSCYNVFLTFIDTFPDFKTLNIIDWEDIKDKFKELFSLQADIMERKYRWAVAISEGEFKFKDNLDLDVKYDKYLWYTDAIKKEINIEGEWRFYKKDTFNKSNYKLFHDAAAYYRSLLFKQVSDNAGLNIY